MSFFDKLKSGFSAGRAELTSQVSRFRNRKFMEGVTAVCALVSMASDGAGSEEKQKMIGYIKNSDELKVFDTAEVIAFFNKIVANYDFDKEVGKGEAMKYVVRLRDERDAAQLMIRVGIAIGGSDGDFDDKEKACVREICQAVGLSPSDFGL